jgi:penicillin amidase
VLATANARVTPDGYAFPVTLNWMAPYRTERIYKVLEAAHGFTPADSLALQGDVVSTLDQLLAQRIAYAIDNTTGPLKADKTLHQAADLLRNWNGSVDASSPAAAIVDAARRVFWPVLLLPRVKADAALAPATKPDPNSDNAIDQLYAWGERDAVEEQLVMHTPARWLPPGIANWNDLLAAICDRGLREAHAPHDLSTWSKGKAYPIDLEHPIFGRSDLVKNLIGIPVGTGPQPVSGDADTVRQIHGGLAPSERFTADLADPDRTTLNLALGQSGNLSSPWFLDQFDDWLHARTYPLPFTPAASQPGIAHSLTLRPQ